MNAFTALRRLVFGLMAGMCLANPTFAASDYLLEIDGIKGESKIIRGAIDALAYSYDVQPPDPRPGHGGKVNMSDISFSIRSGKATPKLMEACAKVKHIANVKWSSRTSGVGGGKGNYLTVTLQDCIISSFSTSTSNQDDIPLETISINFTKATFEFPFITNPDGSPIVLSWTVR